MLANLTVECGGEKRKHVADFSPSESPIGPCVDEWLDIVKPVPTVSHVRIKKRRADYAVPEKIKLRH